MHDIESHYLKDNQGKDLGAKLKVASSAFNKQLGEITDYVFKTVGKEVNKNLDEYANKITKIQKESKTWKLFKDKPTVLTEYLIQADVRARDRLQERVLTEKEGDFAYIEKMLQERKENRKKLFEKKHHESP